MDNNYIAGLVDGDGCFHFSCHLEVKKRYGREDKYPRWRYCFVINMSDREADMLRNIRSILNCGNIYLYKKTGMARYSVENLDDLCDKIVPFFNNNMLHAVRGKCFELWKTGVITLRDIKNKKRFGVGNKINMTQEEELRLISIANEMKKYVHNKPGRSKINF